MDTRPRAAAVPMVLVPALLCDEAMYRGMLAALGESVAARVVVARHPVVVTSIAEILAAAPPRFVLLGSSYGGTVAIELALAAPERVVALCLVGCDPGASDRERSLGIAAMLEATPAAAPVHLALVVVRAEATEAVATFIAMAQRTGGGVGAQMRARAARDDAWARVATLTMPLLVLWGEADAAIPVAVGERIAALPPRAERHVTPLMISTHATSSDRGVRTIVLTPFQDPSPLSRHPATAGSEQLF